MTGGRKECTPDTTFLAKGVGDEAWDRQLHQAETTSADCTPGDPAIPQQSFQNLPDPRNIGIIVLLHKIAFSSMFFYSAGTTPGDHGQDTEAGAVKPREAGRSVPSWKAAHRAAPRRPAAQGAPSTAEGVRSAAARLAAPLLLVTWGSQSRAPIPQRCPYPAGRRCPPNRALRAGLETPPAGPRPSPGLSRRQDPPGTLDGLG